MFIISDITRSVGRTKNVLKKSITKSLLKKNTKYYVLQTQIQYKIFQLKIVWSLTNFIQRLLRHWCWIKKRQRVLSHVTSSYQLISSLWPLPCFASTEIKWKKSNSQLRCESKDILLFNLLSRLIQKYENIAFLVQRPFNRSKK